MQTITIQSREGKLNFQVVLSTGNPVHPQEFHVCARSAVMALDFVGDYCEKHELHNLYATKEELAELCADGQTVEEFAEAHGLTQCGLNGVYVVVHQINKL